LALKAIELCQNLSFTSKAQYSKQNMESYDFLVILENTIQLKI